MAKPLKVTTLAEAEQYALLSVAMLLPLCSLGENQLRHGLANGEIPGMVRIGGRVMVRGPVFARWARGEEQPNHEG